MKIIIALSMLLVFGCASQPASNNNSPPQWIDESWRAASYPSSEWQVGFVKDNANGQPNYQAIEKEALNKLSESILVQVQGYTSVQNASRQFKSGGNSSETLSTDYAQSITTESNLVLAKAETKSYFNKKTGEIYGFAVVKKRDLTNFYKSKMASLFSFADKEFAIMEQLIEQGKKNAALGKIRAVEDSLRNVGSWNSPLQAVESDNSYLDKERMYWQRVNTFKMLLQNGTAIYLDIDNNDLGEQLAAQMQEKNCNCAIAESKETADYKVTIKTKISRCNETKFGEVYCYANATATVGNPKYERPVNVKIPEAKGGWTGGDKDKAIEETFKELVNSLAEQIISTINQ